MGRRAPNEQDVAQADKRKQENGRDRRIAIAAQRHPQQRAGRRDHQRVDDFDEPERERGRQRRQDHAVAVPIAKIRLPRRRRAGDGVVQAFAGMRGAEHRVASGDGGLHQRLGLVEADAERDAFRQLLAALEEQRARCAVLGEDTAVEGGAEMLDGALARGEMAERSQRQEINWLQQEYDQDRNGERPERHSKKARDRLCRSAHGFYVNRRVSFGLACGPRAYMTGSHGERAGTRTRDHLIKSQVLYHLSYAPL